MTLNDLLAEFAQRFSPKERAQLVFQETESNFGYVCSCSVKLGEVVVCTFQRTGRRGHEMSADYHNVVFYSDRATSTITELGREAQRISAEEKFADGWKTFGAQVYAIGKASGFYDHPHTDPGFNHAEKIALMHSELSEALEGLRAGAWPGKPDDKLPHRPMVEVELADTIIRIMNYATHCGLDVAGAVVEKARFNATRGHRHGGKRF